MTDRATPEATRRHADRAIAAGLPPAAFRRLGRSGLVTSALGFGTYRVDESTPDHSAALREALDAGVNLIDTSTNYTNGSSERTVGRAIEGRPRDELIVVSKVGYMQGNALALVRQREKDGRPFADVVKYMDGCWHGIHPEFIEDQLGRSLDRLGLDTIDVYLLHNPEYFLSDAEHRRAGSLAGRRGIFAARIRAAFEHLEKETARGRIAAYGVSSNTFGAPVEDPTATSVERMWTIAREIAGEGHHFSVIQLPANLLETGPVRLANTAGGTKTALQFAMEHDLAVLVNRPLNAIHDGGLVRLADGPEFGTAPVHGAIDPFLPESLRSATLSQKALAVLAHTPGVSCVLNGMRRPGYVEDALGALRVPGFAVNPLIYDALRPA